jgi:hypothetical protein
MRNLLGPNAILTAPAKAHKKQRQILSQVDSLNEQEGSLIAMLFRSIPQAITSLTHDNNGLAGPLMQEAVQHSWMRLS